MNTTMKTVAIVCVIGVVALVGLMGAAAAAGSFSGTQGTGTGMMSGGHMNGPHNGQHGGMMGAMGHMGMMNGTGAYCQNLSSNQCNMTQNPDGTWNCSRYQNNLA
jgi:hypothetical protein